MNILKYCWPVVLCLALLSCSGKDARIRSARQFINQWNYDRALTEIIALRNEKDPEIQYLLGYCYLRKNEYEEAAKYFGISLAIDTTYRDSIIRNYTMLSQNAIKINEPDRALFLYQEIAKLVPEYEQAGNLFLIGDLNYEDANYEAAISAYTRALQIDSTSDNVKQATPRLIRSLAATGDLSEALLMSRTAYEKLKTAANLLLLSEIEMALGVKYYEAGALDSAEIYFGHIISSQEPKSMLDDAYYYTAEICYIRENYGAALEYYKKILRLDPYQKGEITKKAQARIKEIKEKK
jgi:tetratricopeptide (TPR) repeat protein